MGSWIPTPAKHWGCSVPWRAALALPVGTEHTGDLGLDSCPLFLSFQAFSHLNFLPTCISAASALRVWEWSPTELILALSTTTFLSACRFFSQGYSGIKWMYAPLLPRECLESQGIIGGRASLPIPHSLSRAGWGGRAGPKKRLDQAANSQQENRFKNKEINPQVQFRVSLSVGVQSSCS